MNIFSILAASTFLMSISSTTVAFDGKKISLNRNLEVKSCEENGACTPAVAKQDAPSEVDVPLTFGKAGSGDSNSHGEDKLNVTVEGIPFKSEIYLNKSKTGYSLYAALRSGSGTKRKGITKKIDIQPGSEFKPITLEDKPIVINGKKFQAQLTIGPIENKPQK